MLLDSDFDIIKKVNDAAKFTGLRRVVFTSNIRNIEYDGGIYLAASAKVIDNDDELMYKVAVIFPREDVVHYAGTYYGPAYSVPVAYKKGAPVVDKDGHIKGMRIKGYSFELMSSETRTYETEFYNRKTGNREITKNYMIYATAASLKKIEPIHTEMYRLVEYDTVVEETKKIENAVKNFDGHRRVEFTTGVYNRNGYLYAKANVDGSILEISMMNVPMKTTEPNRWAPYYTYRPIINGRGCTIKGHCFDIDVVETKVSSKNEWNENEHATVVTHYYTLITNGLTKASK